jgi:hypothetical protein
MEAVPLGDGRVFGDAAHGRGGDRLLDLLDRGAALVGGVGAVGGVGRGAVLRDPFRSGRGIGLGGAVVRSGASVLSGAFWGA